MKQRMRCNKPIRSNNPRTTRQKKPPPPSKGKEKMPPMERQVPEPLKKLRQKHALEAKILAAQQRHRSGALKEQA
jgi:hypothetical protein